MGTPAVVALAAAPTRSRYRKLLDLASGGMGRVELALAQGEGNFARFVALKRLHAPFEHDEQFRAMFFDEARLAGLVHHPNVGAVVDVGRDEVGFYLAMEYVEGQTLAALIIRLRELRQTLPFQLACRIMAQAAHGLAAAHGLTSLTGEKLDLVHRDVSPQNILIGYDGVVKVVDFGVARAAGRIQTTIGTALKGKLGYMSPEQLSFQSADARSDLFGLGVVLYELLALTRLYRSDDSNDGPRRILTEPAPRLRDLRVGVPKELDELGLRLLAKRPEDRPQTAHEVAQTLEAVASSLAVKEGGVDVGAFIKARFLREIDERRAAIKTVLENEEDIVTASVALPSLTDRSNNSGASVSLVRPSRPEGGPWRTIAMAGIVLGAVIIGATVAIFSSGEEHTAPNASESRAAPSPPPSRPSEPTSGYLSPNGERDGVRAEAPPPTPAPTTATSAPTATTSAPTATTSAPTATTSAPTATTSAPTATTSAPTATTSAPTATTPGPLSPNGERAGVRGEAPTSATATTTSATPPTTSATRPTTSATAPTTSATAPTTSATRPTVSATAPTTSATRPTVSASPPTTSATRPTAPATPPTTSATRPTTPAAARTTTPARATTTTPRTTTPRTRRARSGVRIWEWP